MPEQQNKSIVLASRPIGEPIADNFRLETTSLPEVKDGQVLIKVLYLSLDPYMRGRMSAAKSLLNLCQSVRLCRRKPRGLLLSQNHLNMP